MPKMKTKSGAAKRFQGARERQRIKREQAFKRHILTKKYHQAQAPSARSTTVHETDVGSRSIAAMLPYA